MVERPPPTSVPGNRWDLVEPGPLGRWEPSLPTTIVVPYYQAPGALECTLAAIGAQSYPRRLMQVVVVDDGSDPPLRTPVGPPGVDLRVVHQEDRGFGLARARNNGAAAAEGEIVVFVDCDMVPEPVWLEAHARWHHQVSDALTLGFRRHVEFEGIDAAAVAVAAQTGPLAPMFEGRTQQRPEWIEFHMTRTTDLTSDDEDIFRIVTGGNLGISRGFFDEIGGFDESFTQWGAEDTELGYRAYAAGALLVPEREALCWHQGLGTSPDPNETSSLDQQRAKIAHLIAHHGFRRQIPGRSFTVPHTVVSIQVADEPAELVAETIEQVLGNRFHDLAVLVSVAPAHPHRAWLSRQFGPDPRVAVGVDLDARALHPYAARLVSIPPTVMVRDYALDHLLDELGSAGRLRVPLGGGPEVVAEATRARARVARLDAAGASGPAMAELFGETTADWRDVGIHPRSTRMGRGRGLAGRLRRILQSPDSKAGKIWRQVRGIRSPGDVTRVARWLAGAVGQKLRTTRALPPQPTLAAVGSHPAPGGSPRSVPLGLEVVALGPAAGRVFAASSRVPVLDTLAALQTGVVDDVDVVLVDSEPGANTIELAAARRAAVVRLDDAEHADLAVPAIDPRRVNPIGWVRDVPSHVVAILGEAADSGRLRAEVGPEVRVLAPSPVPGIDVRVVADPMAEAMTAWQVRDVAALHGSSDLRAAALVRLAAAGLVVEARDLAAVTAARLGPELAAELGASPPTDLAGREARSIRLRRFAHRHHSLRVRADQVARAAGLPGIPPTAVSVILATNRPEFLDAAVASVAAQDYPSLELIVALHGDAFEPGTTDRVRSLGSIPTTVVRVPAERSLGDVLNAATRRAGGRLITKWDDDDLYGSQHLWDLVLAHAYSGATLVGKAAEFVYLGATDATVHRFVGGGETYTTTIGGGALMLGSDDLEEIGGWRRVPRHVDRALVEDVELAGGRVYRTHGHGYILNRHGRGHTWDEGERYFLDQAQDQRPGLDTAFAGVD